MAEPEISFSTEPEPQALYPIEPSELETFLEHGPMIVTTYDRRPNGQLRVYVRVMMSSSVIASYQRFTSGRRDDENPAAIRVLALAAMADAAIHLEGHILR